MTDSRRQRYALAGAMAVTVAELVRQTHNRFGGESERAAAQAHGAAAACSAVAARLLLLERDATRAELAVADAPHRPEFAVTTLEGRVHPTWAATVRAVAAAGSELVAARTVWDDIDGDAAVAVRSALSSLLAYIEQLAALLEASEPADGFAGISPTDEGVRG